MAKKNTNTPPAGNDNQAGAGSESKTVATALQKIGTAVLERNPDFQAVHVTADGNAFTAKSDALNHAKTLKSTEVITVEKPKANE